MRLIDADAYKILYDKECPKDCGICDLDQENCMCGLIDKAPTIDAVPVVRCKDCAYFGLNNENVPYCFHCFGLDDPEPNGFCNYGEKKNVD